LRAAVEVLRPGAVIGIGRFAARRVADALDGGSLQLGSILHPSPASPQANRGWEEQARRQLQALGLP
jgi:single-strand selective monofunctional uracil DNA glycosylase